MKKKIPLAMVLTVFLSNIPVAEAQQPSKVHKVGVVAVGDPGPLLRGVRDGLKEAGYIEGKNLVLDVSAKENYDELRPVTDAENGGKEEVAGAVQ